MTRTQVMAAGSAVLGVLVLAAASTAAPARVEVRPNEKERRVDVLVDGQPFTAYVWPERVAKPTLFPIRTASGQLVTRGYPLDPRPGERVDHPHQVGLWLNFGDVNGVDFWGNSEAIKPEERAKMGSIRHRAVVGTKSGEGRGELEVRADWLLPGDKVALEERTRYVFGANGAARSIERVTTLKAPGAQVAFGDTKEGMLGLRVARALEQPADKPEVFVDAAGNPTKVPVLDNKGVTGQYVSSEGLKGDAVWGKAAHWVALTGKLGTEDVALLILDHPGNPEHPTRWHARGYGLFAVNPSGRKAFTDGKEPASNIVIPAGGSITFRHRLEILTGPFSPEAAESAWKRYAAEPVQ